MPWGADRASTTQSAPNHPKSMCTLHLIPQGTANSHMLDAEHQQYQGTKKQPRTTLVVAAYQAAHNNAFLVRPVNHDDLTSWSAAVPACAFGICFQCSQKSDPNHALKARCTLPPMSQKPQPTWPFSFKVTVASSARRREQRQTNLHHCCPHSCTEQSWLCVVCCRCHGQQTGGGLS